MENESAVMIHHILYLLILVCVLGMISGKIASRLRLPDVALFLFAGMLVGQGLHLINETSTSLTNQLILTVGSALILAVRSAARKCVLRTKGSADSSRVRAAERFVRKSV